MFGAAWGDTPLANQLYHHDGHLHSRKNCLPPLSGTTTCHVLPTNTGALVRVVQVVGERLGLDCTEKPALATGQLRVTFPELDTAASFAEVLRVAFGPSTSDARISSGDRRPL